MGIGDMLQAQRDAEDAARFRFLMDPDNADRFPEMWEKLSYKCYGETLMRKAIDDAMRQASSNNTEAKSS